MKKPLDLALLLDWEKRWCPKLAVYCNDDLILLATKSIARIEAFIWVIQIEMIFLDKVFKIDDREVFWIVKFKIITAQLIDLVT